MQDDDRNLGTVEWLHPLQSIAMFWQDLSLTIKGVGLIALPLAILLFSLSSHYIREQEATKLENKLRLALENQRDIQTIHSRLLEASNGVRNYLLTGDRQFLEVFFESEIILPRLLSQLQKKLENNTQKERLKNIYPLVINNLQILRAISENESSVASKDLIDQFKSQVLSLNSLKNQIEHLNAEEAILVDNDQQEVITQRQNNITTTMIAAVTGVLGSILGAWVFSNTIVKRVRILRDCAAQLANSQALDLPSKGRDELGQLSNELEHASQLLSKNINDAMQARREAEEASAAKSMFLSRTSHELRTPLNAILGFAQLLEEELHPGKQRDSVVLIKGAGQHLLKLINEVLEIARIESGVMSLSIEPIDVGQLLKEAQHYIAPLGQIRDIYIHCQVEEKIWAMANRQKLLQVVINLVSNALKYGPDSSTVLIRGCRNNDKIIIQVEDQGKGIASHLKDRAFTPFDRLGAEQTKIEGSGLGLAVSKQLTEAMHGKIYMAENKGLFWLELPIAEPNLVINAEQLATRLELNETSRFKKIILYVEDNPSNRALVQAIIQRQPNLKLDCAATIREATTYLTQVTPALILVDLHLPDGSGETLVQTIKSSSQHQNTPIIILSADALTHTITRLKSYGISYYLTKPLDVALFKTILRELLSQ